MIRQKERPGRLLRLDPDARFTACWLDPVTGESVGIGEITPDPHGCWEIPEKPKALDTVLLVTKIA